MAARSVGREYLEALLVAFVFATFARTFLFQAFEIPTGSMEKNLLVGDHILVNKFVFGPTVFDLERRLLPLRAVQRGDVVVFRYPRDPSQDFVKRCVGVGGDVVEIVHRELVLNEQPVADRSYTYHFGDDPRADPIGLYEVRPRDNFGPFKVPPGNCFCLGDNRDNSHDSRYWGPVPDALLKGRALLIYWSVAIDDPELGAPPGGWLSRTVRAIGRLARATRWSRCLRVVR
ncbi:MAG TPA: signal peptidase I [Thermoanaerobaculia bacterium]|jgi:signal peptidase I|nr:signal peptidase I [Thermoanaerobaculia bacterium]